MTEARKYALDKLEEEAVKSGCNALIGVHYDYYHFERDAVDHGLSHQVFMYVCVTANGTVVVVEKE